MPLKIADLARGCEQYEVAPSQILKRDLVRYHYRSDDNDIFVCVRPTLAECRAARDEWLRGRANIELAAKRKGLKKGADI